MRTARVYAWSREHPTALDAVLALGLLLAAGVLSGWAFGWTAFLVSVLTVGPVAVGHSLSVVVVQADGAAYAAEHGTAWSRADAVSALATIGSTAREALQETRRVVGVLREDGPPTWS
jgi:Histidine kinase